MGPTRLMANTLYPLGKQAFLSGGINLTSDNIKAVLVDLTDYTYSAAHDNLDDIPAGARVATSGNLASKTVAAGVFDAADVVFTAPSGDGADVIAIYKDTGDTATSTLIAYIDTGSGLPVTPNGLDDITIAWADGIIFAL